MKAIAPHPRKTSFSTAHVGPDGRHVHRRVVLVTEHPSATVIEARRQLMSRVPAAQRQRVLAWVRSSELGVDGLAAVTQSIAKASAAGVDWFTLWVEEGGMSASASIRWEPEMTLDSPEDAFGPLLDESTPPSLALAG